MRHDWLFSRVSAVVHHGGGGTTAAALAAGKPQVVCPFVADRPISSAGELGERLRAENGVGVAVQDLERIHNGRKSPRS